MDPIAFRAVERILAVAIGGLSVVLGYRLFLAVPEQRDSSGQVRLPWNISVALARVGPGVFFALFGAAVVGYSLHGTVRVTEPAPAVARAAGGGREVVASGLVPRTDDDAASITSRRVNERWKIEFLNALRTRLRSDLHEEDRRVISTQVVDFKLAVMQPLWAADWGDFATFKDWAGGGATDPVPKGSERAAEYFRFGEGEAR